jgi:hypothetical protein
LSGAVRLEGGDDLAPVGERADVAGDVEGGDPVAQILLDDLGFGPLQFVVARELS